MAQGSASGVRVSKNVGVLVAILTAVAFAGSGPFGKPLLNEGWSAPATVWTRVTCAGLVLLPICLIAARHDLRVYLRRWKWIVGYGVTGVAATQLFYYSALAVMPVAVALLLQYLSPVILLLVAWARTKHRPAWLSLGGAALAVTGLVLALDLSSTGSVSPIGIFYGICAAVAVCGYYLIAEAIPEDLPPVGLAGGGLLVASAAIGVLGATGILPMTFVFGEVTLLGGRAPWWVAMSVVVLVGTVVGYLGGIISSKAVGARLASFLGLLEVIATMIISAVMLGELPTSVQVLGATLVIAGVISVRLAPDTVSLDAPLGPITAPITLPITLPPASPAAKEAAREAARAAREEQLARLETGMLSVIDVDPAHASQAHLD